MMINRCGGLAGKVSSSRRIAALTSRAFKDGDARLADQLTHEENILYLMSALDQALARKTPQWAPQQMDVARRWLASLLERLLEIIPKS
jgi:hypothetical protein